MSTSVFIARMLGPPYILLAIAMLFRPAGFAAVLRGFDGNPALLYLSGLVALFAGWAIVLTHNLWVADWRLLITLTGWLAVAKGASIILLPRPIAATGDWMAVHNRSILGSGIFALVFGLALSWFGFR